MNDRGDRKPMKDRKDSRDKSRQEKPIPAKNDRQQNTMPPLHSESGERIAKRLARAGIASRRDAEMMIVAGRIAVNGKRLDSPAFNVRREDTITVDGKALPPIERTRLWLYHKKAGLVTTNRDPEGRPTVFDSLPDAMPRVLSVGRLDINTEGLLLLTNDGGLARVLELPSTGWVRKYRVRAHGKIKQSQLDELKNGIAINGIFYGSVEASIEREQGTNVWLNLALREGKNREVKNILGALGLTVARLIRVSFGPFQLADLEEGAVRELKGRVLRDQLGERLIEEANADFESPILQPFSNGSVVSDKPAFERPKVSEDGWISSSPAPMKKGGRSKKGDYAERGRERLNTKGMSEAYDDRPSRTNQRSPMNKKADTRKDKTSTEETAQQQTPRSRSANVWMAPGARPQTAHKRKWHRDKDQSSPPERRFEESASARSTSPKERNARGHRPFEKNERDIREHHFNDRGFSEGRNGRQNATKPQQSDVKKSDERFSLREKTYRARYKNNSEQAPSNDRRSKRTTSAYSEGKKFDTKGKKTFQKNDYKGHEDQKNKRFSKDRYSDTKIKGEKSSKQKSSRLFRNNDGSVRSKLLGGSRADRRR
ncbi:pseudouridine synthase [Bartonella tamiae Th307]|uniref:Pseudouridine synthase n=2 Tax=Bartonella tamiae TaxID=373638 RepID=J0QXK2_9HYPH|nr:pseudouridine synthase [Bartonella tamiae Th239]EJF93424.1 pseudouridine synthase [Bartonella tamiae Th307]